MRSSLIPRCPDCAHFDQSRKVSAIYSAGTPWTDNDRGSVLSQTNLAVRLALPPRPQATGCLAFCFGVASVALAMLTVCSALLGLLMLRFSGNGVQPLVVLIVGVPLIACTCSTIIAFLFRWREQRRLARTMAAWEVDMITWEQTYYCSRYNEVYIPAPAWTAQPA
jgi:hypothetical protein